MPNARLRVTAVASPRPTPHARLRVTAAPRPTPGSAHSRALAPHARLRVTAVPSGDTHARLVVIAFWASLAAFVVLLFLVLLSMSRPAPAPGATPRSALRAPGASTSASPSASGGTRCSPAPPRGPRPAQPGSQAAGHPGSPPRPPPPPRPTLLSCGNGPWMGTPTASADVGHTPAGLPLETVLHQRATATPRDSNRTRASRKQERSPPRTTTRSADVGV
ncbi:hypothetical protein QTO34_014943 [Cnephaeus nilssonii]|uniref:Uncharacterized protein n=1 Tax=Cnephaeus nilssonii TaxID=3371016 RepID=A0AA40I8A8_CNENI|nr:hypothetical protein QTO34_014943 [Eptesicus nilssonii]